jgi:RHS repeat-associated protein
VSVSARHTGQPESYYHGEGRVALTDSVPRFQYKLTDHLGNTMVLFEDRDGDGIITTESNPAGNEVLQRNFYYAFGLPMQGPWNHTPTDPDMPYLYNGKELEGELGLGWMDYGARRYDAAIGRWGGVDPLAILAPDWTPYRYGFNNPVLYIDPNGLFERKSEARSYRRNNTSLKWWNSSIKKNKDGNYDIRDDNSNLSITRDGNGEVEYSATASGYGYREREAGFWENRKHGGFAGQVMYGMANSVYVLGQLPFYGRGDNVPTLDGFSVVKGSNEGIDAGVTGLLIVAPIPFPKGFSSSAQRSSTAIDDIVAQMQQAGFIHFRKINGGVLINNSLRIQLHKHPLNPIKGRGYSGSISSTHININNFHIIMNPQKWDALSTWRYTPFRF